jgi:hypothetical protein
MTLLLSLYINADNGFLKNAPSAFSLPAVQVFIEVTTYNTAGTLVESSNEMKPESCR